MQNLQYFQHYLNVRKIRQRLSADIRLCDCRAPPQRWRQRYDTPDARLQLWPWRESSPAAPRSDRLRQRLWRLPHVQALPARPRSIHESWGKYQPRKARHGEAWIWRRESAERSCSYAFHLHALGVDAQMQHTPMAGSELFGSELLQLFVGVAMMQHEHAWAGTGNHGCETMGT